MRKRVNSAKWMEKHNRWQINVQKDGQRRCFYSSTPGRAGQRECNTKADAWLDDGIVAENTKVSILFDQYVESLKLTTSESNWIKIASFGKNWINPSIGHRKISSITEQNLQDIINKAFSEGLAKKTLMNLRGTIVSFLKYCRKCRCCSLFPESLTVPKGAKVCEKNILQPDDLIILFSKDTTQLYQKEAFEEYIYAFRFQVLTGLRPGELIGLRWSDIVNDTVYIRRSINYRNQETKGKNDNAIRCFNLNKHAKQMLKYQKDISITDSVFQITSLSHYEKRWVRYREANGISKITPYEMRHTFISVANELSEGQLKPLVGHSKNMDTFGVYGHEVSGSREKTAAKIGEIFDEILGSVL